MQSYAEYVAFDRLLDLQQEILGRGFKIEATIYPRKGGMLIAVHVGFGRVNKDPIIIADNFVAAVNRVEQYLAALDKVN